MADVGTGGSITFGTSSWTGSIMSVEWGGIEREVIDTSHLGTTTARTKIPGDLYDPGDLTVNIQWDPNVPPPYSGAAETITVTYPVPSGGSTGATYAATGFISSFSPGSMGVDELMEGEFTITFSGAITQADSA